MKSALDFWLKINRYDRLTSYCLCHNSSYSAALPTLKLAVLESSEPSQVSLAYANLCFVVCFLAEENWEPKRLLLPCPVPLMMPAPVAMYTTPTPVPIIVPVPIPVPCFIPTSRKTSKKIFKKIKVFCLQNLFLFSMTHCRQFKRMFVL
jgi:hypothetical protein